MLVPQASRPVRPSSPTRPARGRTLVVALAATVGGLLVAGCGATSTTNVGPSPTKCEVTLSGASVVGPGGGAGTITVSTQPECNWTATTAATWITRLTPRTGQGPGQIEFEAASNPASGARQSEVVVNDVRIAIRQDVTLCSFEVSPAGISSQASGGGQSVGVTATPGCAWTATSGASWIQITSGASGSGVGTVNLQINGNNTGAVRNGAVTVAGRTIPVAQSATGSCTYTVTPGAYSAPASGGASSVSLTTPDDCAWAASDDVPWLSLTSPTLGTGSATITFTAATNTGPQRTGTLSIADRIVTVTQASGCVYSLQSSTASIGAGAASLSTAVATNAGCTWTATSNVSWISVSSGQSGTGSGTVAIAVAANPSPARTGTVSIAGQTYSVTQADGCTYAVTPGAADISSLASSAAFAVATGPSCPWTASTSVPWITVATPAGAGQGSAGVTAVANAGPARAGTITVAGQDVTLRQASGCAFTLSPTSATFGVLGGPSSFALTASDPGCPWTATTTADWISIQGSGNGTGNGTVVFVVAPVLTRRTGTIVAGGQTFTVTQN